MSWYKSDWFEDKCKSFEYLSDIYFTEENLIFDLKFTLEQFHETERNCLK